MMSLNCDFSQLNASHVPTNSGTAQYEERAAGKGLGQEEKSSMRCIIYSR